MEEAVGGETMSELRAGACGCGSTVTTTAITQACAALVTKQHFNDTVLFFFGLKWQTAFGKVPTPSK